MNFFDFNSNYHLKLCDCENYGILQAIQMNEYLNDVGSEGHAVRYADDNF